MLDINKDTPISFLTVGQLIEIFKAATIQENQPATTAQEPDRISKQQAIPFLGSKGFKVSKSLLDKATSNRAIPCTRFGRMLLFTTKDLLTWAESKCITQPTRKHEVSINLAKSANKKGANQ